MPSGIEALAGRLDLSDAHELGDRLPIACDGDLLLALQHRLGSRPTLAQVPHGDGLHGARLTCFTTLGPTGQIGATSLETRSVTRILAVRALRVATLRATTPASHPAPGCCGGALPRTRNALTLSNTEGSEHVAVCTDGCETRRGHHRNWTGGSRQEPSERPPPGELVDASLWAGLEHDPADDEVPQDLPCLRDLSPQHRPPVGQAVADLALQGGISWRPIRAVASSSINARSQHSRCAWRSLTAARRAGRPPLATAAVSRLSSPSRRRISLRISSRRRSAGSLPGRSSSIANSIARSTTSRRSRSRSSEASTAWSVASIGASRPFTHTVRPRWW